ncbi:MAG: Gfo/Idh/MocA family oxidoreductase [Dehalococcoidia bacterium]
MLDDPGEAVVIATRHDTHAALAAAALRAGKAVFVEKPLALSWEELAAVRAAQGESGGRLMVGFNRRFAPLVEAIAARLAGRAEPLVITCRVNAGYLPPDHWLHDPAAGGGRIAGEACHFIDLMRHLAGAPITDIYARAMANAGRYRTDNVAIVTHFADGSLGTLTYHANGAQRLAKERIEVHGQGLSFVLDDFRSLTTYRGMRREERRGRQDKGHTAEVAAFVQAIRTGTALPIPFDECVESTAATLAALDALALGAPLPAERWGAAERFEAEARAT